MRKQVIAEWVETPDALKMLLEMGTQFGQGFLFRRPQPIVSTLSDLTGALKRQTG